MFAGENTQLVRGIKSVVVSLAAVSFSLYGYAFQRAWNSTETNLIIPLIGSRLFFYIMRIARVGQKR